MHVENFSRFVALGDSQTEGLHDYDEHGRPRGWADRFAERLSRANPELVYANLAVRGKRTAEIRRDQLEAAVAMRPDLATVVSGVNDVLRPRADLDAVAGEIEAMYRTLRSTGCLVMSCTFPLPRVGLTRRAVPILLGLNRAIREAADRQDVLLVELEDLPEASDLRLWNADRIHLNPEGHRRLAAAFEGTLLGTAREEWIAPLPPTREPFQVERLGAEALWIARFVVPKIVRMLRGRSSGDGRSAKRPELRRVVSP